MTDDTYFNDSTEPRRYRVTRLKPVGGIHAVLYGTNAAPHATMSRIMEVAPDAYLSEIVLGDKITMVDAGTPLTDWKDDVN